MKNKSRLVSEFDFTEYKKRNIQIWNEIALRYHQRWASIDVGPFQSSDKLIELSGIKEEDSVIDFACGTGVVTKKISNKINKKGMVIGIDSSKNAINIARKWCTAKNTYFIVSDVEKIELKTKFDVMTCQYALFFFPDAQNVLKRAKLILKNHGKIAISVHGNKKNVPYFSCILDEITKVIPDYIPENSLDLDRFGTSSSMKKIISESGFVNEKIKEFTFTYSPGTFQEFWENYLRYVPIIQKKKIEKLAKNDLRSIRENVKENTRKFVKNGKIVFPWKVLVAVADV